MLTKKAIAIIVKVEKQPKVINKKSKFIIL